MSSIISWSISWISCVSRKILPSFCSTRSRTNLLNSLCWLSFGINWRKNYIHGAIGSNLLLSSASLFFTFTKSFNSEANESKRNQMQKRKKFDKLSVSFWSELFPFRRLNPSFRFASGLPRWRTRPEIKGVLDAHWGRVEYANWLFAEICLPGRTCWSSGLLCLCRASLKPQKRYWEWNGMHVGRKENQAKPFQAARRAVLSSKLSEIARTMA